jgi:hypothetical protein
MSERTMGEIVADALASRHTPYEARPAICRLLLADAKLNSEAAADKYEAQFAPDRPARASRTRLETETLIDDGLAFLHKVGHVHDECAELIASHKSAERPRGEYAEWARIDAELIAGLERCATNLEALAETYSRSRGTGRAPR